MTTFPISPRNSSCLYWLFPIDKKGNEMNEKLNETVGGYSWPYIIKDDGTAEIIGKPSPMPEGTLAIPEKLGGRIVSSIGDRVFMNCGMTGVTIPDSVTSIGDGAFYGCWRLSDANGFVIVRNALYSYHGADGAVTIPDTVKVLDAFAFHECDNIKSVTIPAGVTAIPEGAFEGCSRIKSFKVSPDNPAYTSADGLLLTKDGKILVRGLNQEAVVIPEGVMRIADGAFSDCGKLTTVTIPVGVTSIGEEAFARCRWLKDVVLPFDVTTIEEYAFFCCSGLKAVTIPSSVAVIGRHAFRDCLGLTVTMENGVTSIKPTALTVRVSTGDAERVRKLLADAEVDTSNLTIKENKEIS